MAPKKRKLLKKEEIVRSLKGFVQDEDGFVSKATILKVGLSAAAGPRRPRAVLCFRCCVCPLRLRHSLLLRLRPASARADAVLAGTEPSSTPLAPIPRARLPAPFFYGVWLTSLALPACAICAYILAGDEFCALSTGEANAIGMHTVRDAGSTAADGTNPQCPPRAPAAGVAGTAQPAACQPWCHRSPSSSARLTWANRSEC